MPKSPLTVYKELQKLFTQDVKSMENGRLLTETISASLDFLKKTRRVQLNSLVPNKGSFSFELDRKS